MPFFDFHCHPGMKSRLAPAGQEPTPWQTIKVQLEILHSIKINISPMFADALDSQASLHQLWRGNVNLIGLIVHSIESKVAGQLLSKGIVRNGKIQQLDPGKIQLSAAGDSYYGIIRDELKRLTDNAVAPASMGLPAGTKLKFIRSMEEYDRNDLNTIHAILILEGSQNLFNNPAAPDFKEQFFNNLDDLSKSFRIFAMNTCHFQQQLIANHAFGMQFLDNEPFYPTGHGITAWGRDVILELYKRNILIDIKHMGLVSRQNLYDMRKLENVQQPLICSHAGVTGISVRERLDYFYHEPPEDEGTVWKVQFLKKWGHINDTAYNMSSIGLYDEDIIEVLRSKGMIGISLDQRILGFPADEPLRYKEGIYPTDLDYISKLEAVEFFMNRPPDQCGPREEDNDEVMNFDDAVNQNEGNTADLHARYFLNQVLHILFVAKNNPSVLTIDDAAKRICLGSDLDGLINPIDCCTTVAGYDAFKQQLLGIMSKKSFWKGTGLSLKDVNPASLLEGIFFNNAFSFLNEHYKAIN
jgi:hypothetical protein